jgi:AcrR family transcriptional regulator
MTGRTATRMPADERRALVLDAATRAFARGGYHGTSTDAVAKQAGVSQPYVVRMFGTKLELFTEVFDHAASAIDDAFVAVIADGDFDPASDDDWGRLGQAYAALVTDRDLLMVMMHGFSAGAVDEIAARSRACMGRIYATLRSTGADEERIRDFVAHGMLINVMLSMRADEHLEDDLAVAAFAACVLGDEAGEPAPGHLG